MSLWAVCFHVMLVSLAHVRFYGIAKMYVTIFIEWVVEEYC